MTQDGSVIVSWTNASRRFVIRFACENIACWHRIDTTGFEGSGFHTLDPDDDFKQEVASGFRWLMGKKEKE
jgi:hypothetical protein